METYTLRNLSEVQDSNLTLEFIEQFIPESFWDIDSDYWNGNDKYDINVWDPEESEYDAASKKFGNNIWRGVVYPCVSNEDSTLYTDTCTNLAVFEVVIAQ